MYNVDTATNEVVQRKNITNGPNCCMQSLYALHLYNAS